MDDVLVGSRVFCGSCIFVFMRAWYPVPISPVSGAGPIIHTWVDVELRVVGQRVAVNKKNPNCRGCAILVHSKSRLSIPGLVFLRMGWVPFVVLCQVIWPEPRCWGYQNNLGWLVSWKVWQNWCIWGILCLSFGAWSILCCAAVWPRFVAKLCERGFLFARIEWYLMIRRIRGRSLDMVAAGLTVVGLVAAEILGGGIVVEAQ